MCEINLQKGLFLCIFPELCDRKCPENSENGKILLSSSIAFYRHAEHYSNPSRTKVSKRGSKKASFYAFFRNYANGSARKNPKTSNSNSANRELSIEVQFVHVVIVEPKLLKEALKRGLFTRFYGITRPQVSENIRKHQISTQLIKSFP